MSHSVPGRTDSVCMRRWKMLQRWGGSGAAPRRFGRPPPAGGRSGGKRKQPGAAEAQGSKSAQGTGPKRAGGRPKRKQTDTAEAQGSKPAQGTGPAAGGDAAPVSVQQHGAGNAEAPGAAAESNAAAPGGAAAAQGADGAGASPCKPWVAGSAHAAPQPAGSGAALPPSSSGVV